MKQASRLLFPFCIALFSSFILTAQNISFSDHGDTLLISNSSYYELGILKSNGAITHITQEPSGERIILGSLENNLWSIGFSNGTWLNSSEFVGSFDYAWDDSNKKLVLNYTNSGDVSVSVSIKASDENYLDFQLFLNNSSDYVISRVSFPNTLKFDETKIQNGLFPDKPGLMLSSNFFANLSQLADGIMGIHPPTMADYLGLQTDQTTFALYSLWGTAPLQINRLGFKHLQGTNAGMIHLFSVWRPKGYNWTSVPVRLRLSNSFEETIQDYRIDNQIDNYSPLKEKLGDKYSKVVQSPYISFDGDWFGEYTGWPQIFKTFRAPAIIYISNYYPGGFHGYFPDVIPPNPVHGTTEEFKAAIDSAHAYNLLTMPMILPNWWHENSPTIQGLNSHGLTIDSIAFIDTDGNPSYSSWSLAGRIDNGYNVSPRVPFVLDRLDQLMNSLTNDIGFDIIYEDVIGAGNTESPDFNSYAPDTLDTESWLDHTRTYKDHLLLTETGSDIFAESDVGFLGGGHGPDWNDSPDIKAWPMSAFLMKDKVLHYHYWGSAGTTNKASLSWNLAFGYMLNIGYNPSNDLEAPGSKWFDVHHKFHTKIVRKYADQLLNSYSELNSGKVMNCVYDSMIIVANRDTINGFAYNNHVISSSGVLAYTPDEKTIAGIFRSFNGQELEGGDQFLIVEEQGDSIEVSHPLGESTLLTLQMLSSWTPDNTLWAKAYDKKGKFIDALEVSCNENTCSFNCLNRVQGYLVDHFTIVKNEERPTPDWIIYFNDEYAGEMYLGNKDYYEIKIANYTSAIYYIIDKRSADTISMGSEWGRLWIIEFPDAPNGSQFMDPMNVPTIDSTFYIEKEWSLADSTLTLNYISTNTTKIEGSVSITISALNHFDIQMSFNNSWGYTAKNISFPYHLIFGYDSTTTALLPFEYPGARLKPSFFSEQKGYTSIYPNRFTSDFVQISNKNGDIAIYSLWKDEPVKNVQLGLIYNLSGFYFYEHQYYTSVENGMSWISPKIRFRIGDSQIETLNAYRTDNIPDAATYLLKNKMDSITYNQYIKSPLIFNPFGSSGHSFNSFANWASGIPSPSIMLLSEYYPDGEFGSHPDVLPPDYSYGTENEFKRMIDDLHFQQKLVVPYTIPNWWNENSPTVLNLSSPNMIDSLSFKQSNGSPTSITFNGSDNGYLMSATPNFVKQRVADNFSQLKGTYACDFIFEDKLNAMQINADHDAGYHQGWLDHLKNYKDSSILISSGYDRQFANASGNLSTMYFDVSEGPSPLDYDFGDNNWEYFPTWPIIFNDMLINFQSRQYPTTGKDILSWNMLYGCSLSYMPENGGTISNTDSTWLNIIGVFQSKVLSEIVSKEMTDYAIIDEKLVKSVFDDIQVIRNNDLVSEHEYEQYAIAPEGILVKSNDGNLVAGILHSFNNENLSPGDHYLVVEKTEKEQFIYHPLGDETTLTLERPLAWSDSSRIKTVAYTAKANSMLTRTITPNSITFDMPLSVSDESVSHFRVFYSDSGYSCFSKDTSISIYPGDSIFWRNRYYSEIGTYYDSLTTSTGCDSIYSMHLVISTGNAYPYSQYDFNIVIYPNPSNGLLMVNTQHLNEVSVMGVFSLDGRMIKEHILEPHAKQIKLDLTYLTPGVHILKIKYKDNNYRFKLIIQ